MSCRPERREFLYHIFLIFCLTELGERFLASKFVFDHKNVQHYLEYLLNMSMGKPAKAILVKWSGDFHFYTTNDRRIITALKKDI